MRKFITRICNCLILRGARHHEVGQFDGIRLADLRGSGDSFRQMLGHALEMVEEHDPRRYARIKRFIHWIVNHINAKGSHATYDFSIRTCYLEFCDDFPSLSRDTLAALYAGILVHESTHGLIAARGIEYCADDRVRIERLCVKEQNRFASRLVASDPALYPRRLLIHDFDAVDWEEHWALSPLARGLSLLTRAWTDKPRTPPRAERR